MATILVVDDDSVSREILEALLEDADHCVLLASSGDEAIEIFKKNIVDAVITDIFMPGKTGLDTIRELREINPQVKVATVSGGSTFTAHEMLQWAENGVGAHTLQKPLKKTDVLKTVNELLAGR